MVNQAVARKHIFKPRSYKLLTLAQTSIEQMGEIRNHFALEGQKHSTTKGGKGKIILPISASQSSCQKKLKILLKTELHFSP